MDVSFSRVIRNRTINARKKETVVPKIQKLFTIFFLFFFTIFIRINFYKCDNEDVAISSLSTETANLSECGQDKPQK